MNTKKTMQVAASSQTAENYREQDSHKNSQRRKKTLIHGSYKKSDGWLLITNNGGQKTMEQALEWLLEENKLTTNLEFYIQQKYS